MPFKFVIDAKCDEMDCKSSATFGNVADALRAGWTSPGRVERGKPQTYCPTCTKKRQAATAEAKAQAVKDKK